MAAPNLVTIMSRYPHALNLAVYDDTIIQDRRNTVNMTAPVPTQRFTLAGAIHDSRYHLKDNNLLGMAGKTQISADLWEAWLAQNRTNPLVTGQVVFAETTEARAEARKAELSTSRTGMEGLNPDSLPVKGVRKDDRKAETRR